jgi:uncharacterized protein YlxW (UPF0749 family)
MKNSILILAILACFASIQDVSAQLSKKEKKEWKKKQKSMNPSDFKDLVEENTSLKSKLSSLNNQVSGLQAKMSESESMTESLRKDSNLLTGVWMYPETKPKLLKEWFLKCR